MAVPGLLGDQVVNASLDHWCRLSVPRPHLLSVVGRDEVDVS